MLISNWKMSYEEYKDLPCEIPCSMYSVLLEHNLIDDPFYGDNAEKYTCLSEKDCTFVSEFYVDSEMLKKEFAEIVFWGLDTICDIFLNSEKLMSVKNMHRAYVCEVKDRLKIGKNQLRLEFKSPIQYFNHMNNKHYVYSTTDALPGIAHLRKSFCMSGWDWGPQLPDMGIFRPIEIDFYNYDRIENIEVKQQHKENEVELKIAVETIHDSDCELYAQIGIDKVKLENGKGKITIKNPKLWWVRGFGDQYLYDLKIIAVKNGDIIDEKSQKIGLRTLTISTKLDEDDAGSEFCFVLNGVKIFAMGANYIPQDSLIARVSRDKTLKLIESAIDANFNCLRVWGGGYYPDDDFYEICDAYGILVWQDFMVACANVWLRNEFKEEFIEEAKYNVKRIRNHPCIGILSGNNEMEEALVSWGIGESMLVKSDYIELYERILPEICEELAPDIFYWASSPSSGGGFDDPQCESRGDVHFWKVWSGGAPFTEYRKHKFRFCSEYGFESYPSMKTIESFCAPEKMNCFSKVMESHQKNKSGNQKILTYLADDYLYPCSFEKLVYASQLLQADAIKYGVEHFRRHRGYTMGSIYWQFNDCWPVASWSSVDYFGRYKALHYAAKKFYAPIAMGLFVEGKALVVNISNETMKDFSGEVRVYRRNAFLDEKSCEKVKVNVKKLSASDVININISDENKFSEFICAELYDENGHFIMQQTELLVKPKHFEWQEPKFDIKFTDVDGGVEIHISSNVFAKGVYLEFCDDVKLSDNFFDITNTSGYDILARTECTSERLRGTLKIMSVYDIGI